MAGKRVSRRDYNKMVNGNDSESEGDNENVVSEEEMTSKVTEEVQYNDGEASPTEEEVAELEERIRKAKVAKGKLDMKEKTKRLSLEADLLEEEVRAMTLKGKKKEKVNASSLRKMDKVVKKVDRVMNEKLNNLSASSSSSAG